MFSCVSQAAIPAVRAKRVAAQKTRTNHETGGVLLLVVHPQGRRPQAVKITSPVLSLDLVVYGSGVFSLFSEGRWLERTFGSSGE